MSNNTEQQRAIKTTEGPVVVVAPAGSGKTRVLVARIAHLIEDLGVPPDAILGVTFTRKSAAEWRDRLAALLGQERAAGVTLGTFHSLGLRLLREASEEIGLERRVAVADSDGGGERMRRIASTLPRGAIWARGRAIAHAFSHVKQQLAADAADSIKRGGVAAHGVLAYRRGEGLRWPDSVPPEARSVLTEAFRQYQASLHSAGAVDLQDLIALPLVVASENLTLRHRWMRRWAYLLVDEYQDTDPLQDVFLDALSAHTRNLCVVGDPAQAIYGWRGALSDSMRTFPERHQGTQIIALSHNYRSTPEIILAAEAGLRGSDPKALLAEAIPTQPSGNPVEVWTCTDDESEGEAVARDILERAMIGAQVETNEILVLGRGHSVLEPVERALRRHGIPFSLASGRALTERPGVRGALLRLQLLAFPDDAEALHHLRDDLVGVGPSTIERLRGVAATNGWSIATGAANAADLPGVSRTAQASLEALANEIELIGRVLESHGLQEALRVSIEASGLPQRVTDALAQADEEGDDGEEAAVEGWLADAEELLRLGAVWSQPKECGDSTEALRAFLTDLWTGAPMEWVPSGSNPHDWSDHPPVRLMTIHAAKGLEAEWVYLVGGEEGTLPAGSARRRTEEQLGEEARLWYVGATRAKVRLVVSGAMLRGRHEGTSVPMLPSRFLASIPTTCHIRRMVPAWSRGPLEDTSAEMDIHGAMDSSFTYGTHGGVMAGAAPT